MDINDGPQEKDKLKLGIILKFTGPTYCFTWKVGELGTSNHASDTVMSTVNHVPCNVIFSTTQLQCQLACITVHLVALLYGVLLPLSKYRGLYPRLRLCVVVRFNQNTHNGIRIYVCSTMWIK